MNSENIPAPRQYPGLYFPDHSANLLGQYAGFVSRLIAFFIDVILLTVIIVATGGFIQATASLFQLETVIEQISTIIPILGLIYGFLSSPLAFSIFSMLIVAAYYVFFWTFAGQTIGKGLMGLRVVPIKGGRLKAHQALIRYLGYYVSAVALGLGFLAILVNDRRLGWHDRFARTCVIYVWNARPDERFLVKVSEKLIGRIQSVRQAKNHSNLRCSWRTR
jgi:uncharacterized RDD family membrane protein YckC